MFKPLTTAEGHKATELEQGLRFNADEILFAFRCLFEGESGKPPFRNALKNERRITAWVTVNDATFMIAMRFLRKCGIEPGTGIDLVSIDDTIDVLQNGLASYDSDIPAIAAAGIDFLTRPDSFHRFIRVRPSRSPGLLLSGGPERYLNPVQKAT